jgi:hypothetical protein
MIDQYLTGTIATGRQQDNERRIVAAELRRQATVARHTTRVSPLPETVVAASQVPIPRAGLLVSMRHALHNGLSTLVGRRAPA